MLSASDHHASDHQGNLNTGFLEIVSWWIVGKQESAGINRHVVGDARALQERK
jgi:hypothetical protein